MQRRYPPAAVSSACHQEVAFPQTSVSLFDRELTEAAYEKLADETLEALADYFEDLADEAFTGPEYDVLFSVRRDTFTRSAVNTHRIISTLLSSNTEPVTGVDNPNLSLNSVYTLI